MSESKPIPQIGQLVRVLKGRDTDKLAVIIGILNERFVLIADGDKRKYDSPKKKNVNHLHFYDFISRDVHDSIEETGRVTNRTLRVAVNKFKEQIDTKDT